VIQKFAPQRLINGLSEHGDEKVRLYINNFVGMSDNTLSGIYSELSKNVVPLVTDDEVVSALSRKNVVTPEDLEYGYDVFIKIPEHLLRQWKSLLTLIVNQFLTFFERRDENNDRPILFLLDEFPRLGKIPAIIDGLATLRSRKITIALIVQSLAQLDHIYGHNARKVIADTCAYKAILGATDAETQEYFSRLFGTYDKTITSYGTQNEYFTGFPRGSSTSTYEQERRIIKPEEFGHMNNIALLSPFGFSIIDKAPYYGG
jgi:type IV secretion system protein VirD4